MATASHASEAGLNPAPLFPMSGGCICGNIRYTLTTSPLIIGCCHCTYCQRETGSAFALNAVIEADRVSSSSTPIETTIPSESGKGQIVSRCPECHITAWSTYGFAGPCVRMVKVGTLDEAGRLRPGVHMFVRSKQDWVIIEKGERVFEGFYRPEECWGEESLERYRSLLPKIEAWRKEMEEKS